MINSVHALLLIPDGCISPNIVYTYCIRVIDCMTHGLTTNLEYIQDVLFNDVKTCIMHNHRILIVCLSQEALYTYTYITGGDIFNVN